MVVQQDIYRERVRRTFNDGVAVFAELGRRGVGELGLGPGLGVDGDVQEHLAIAIGRHVAHGHDRELAHNSERDHATRVLSNAEVFDTLVLCEEVRGGDQTTGGKRVHAIRGRALECDTVDEVFMCIVLEVLAPVSELTSRGIQK